VRGRGAIGNPAGRFEVRTLDPFDDGWGSAEQIQDAPVTEVREEFARTILSKNSSPDIPFDVSLNAYRGCEHGCIYCFARPTHAYLDLSPGLDFETKLFAKPNAAELLRSALRKPGYKPTPIALGTNTDPYQPIERRYELTRKILEVLQEFRHPATIVTKSALVLRDIDLLQSMARAGRVHVYLSVTTLDRELARTMEPRAGTPERRLQTLAELARAGIPCGVLAAPMIPALNDHELESILEAARDNGVGQAAYILLRLPHEVAPLFQEWLQAHYPDKASHVLSLMRQMRGGQLYRAEWGRRMRGTGPFAELLRRRFETSCRRLGLNRQRPKLDIESFRVPAQRGDQTQLF
jgi:DNA repair photolyase